MSKEQDKERIERLRDRLRTDPNDEESWRGLAQLLQRAEDREGAVNAWKSLLEVAPDDVQAHAHLVALAEDQPQDEQDGKDRISSLRSHLRKHPEDANSWRRLGHLQTRAENWEGAAAAWRGLHAADPTDVRGTAGLAAITLALNESNGPRDEWTTKQAARLRKEPEAADLWKRMAERLTRLGDFEGAAIAWNGLLSVEPQNIVARGRLLGLGGLAAEAAQQGDAPQGEASEDEIENAKLRRLQAALHKRPEDLDAWRRLAERLERADDVVGALEAWKGLLVAEPESAAARLGVARLTVRLSVNMSPESHVHRLHDHLRKNPEDDKRWRRLAESLEEAGDWEGAKAALEAVMTLAPDDVSVRLAWARLKIRSSSSPAVTADRVVKQCSRLLKKPDDVEAWRLLGERLSKNKDDENATLAWEALLLLEPADIEARGNLAEAAEASGDADRAREHLRAMVELAPEDPTGWRLLAKSLDRSGDKAGAEAAWREVLKLNAADKTAQKRLGTLLYSRGRTAEAINLREAALSGNATVDQEAATPDGAELVQGVGRRTSSARGRGEGSEQNEQVHETLRQMAEGDKPIVVGPWQSEVGHELLYWTPFLRWAVGHFGIDPARIHVITRGGAGCWYGGIASGGTYDIFDCMTPEAFSALADDRHRATGGRKASFMDPNDAKIITDLGLPTDADLLHPEMMFDFFKPYLRGRGAFEGYRNHTAFERLEKPEHDICDELPSSFTAVKFYARPSFPMTEENAEFVRRLTLGLAEQGPVVFMDTAIKADEHEDFEPPEHPNVIGIRQWMKPSDNLLAQSCVISRATQVYGTYGGFAYLPLYYGVPSCSFFSDGGHFLRTHGQAAHHLSEELDTPLGIVHTGPIANLLGHGGGGTPAPEREPKLAVVAAR